MDTLFNDAFDLTINIEGGYANNAADRGKETIFGISRANWPDWAGWHIVDEIKKEYPRAQWDSLFESTTNLKLMVSSFYFKNFWTPAQCGKFPKLIANELFDTSVNMGITAGGKCLQQALNKLNRNQKDFPDLEVDGKIGEKTVSAFRSYMSTKKMASRNQLTLTEWVLKWMNYFQMKVYDELSKEHPDQEVFIPGWTNRV